MSLKDKCRFANDCEIFQGKKVVNETPLPIFRNVFCIRGMRGWKNCERYVELTNELSKR